MDRTMLADELRGARFHTTRFRTGYDETAVDDRVDLLVERLGSDVPDHEVVATARESRFPTTTARRGYDMADVDALLARVVSALGGGTSISSETPGGERSDGRGSPASSGSWGTGTGTGSQLPSALIEPPRGFLARLLGR